MVPPCLSGLTFLMRYRLISDVHSEFWPENPYRAGKHIDRLLPPMPDDRDTVLLLAGDTGSYRRRNIYRAVIDRLCNRFNAVADIPGNHYGYGGEWDDDTAPAVRDNYRFGPAFQAFGVTACTLWTGFDGGNPEIERECLEGMNDFRRVRGLSVEGVKARHAEHVRFLAERMEEGGIVMTHFAPSRRSLPAAEEGEALSHYYATDLERLILDRRPGLWVHGHIHARSDYRLGDTRILCNPAGYDGRDHDPSLAFEA
ncbi:metallophosphoesterase [Methylobacterium sp. J-072]|uniref:metallophosphoesterase n=1 Tax=Methylobacterium sp. J-072 TaxID=2836651 RepID=UPI0028BE2306|nr:metallophosphoesterase [Methylobacterium sp. J-072]